MLSGFLLYHINSQHAEFLHNRGFDICKEGYFNGIYDHDWILIKL